MPAPRGAPREVPGQRLPGARVWLKGGEGRRSPRAGTEQTCSSSALRGFIHTEMNGTEEAWLVGLFVFNPSPSPTPHNLQHRTEINTRSRGGGCCPRGATTTPPITTHPRQGKVSRSWGAPFQPPRAAWEANPKEHCPPAGTGGPTGWGSRVEAELGGLQVVPGGSLLPLEQLGAVSQDPVVLGRGALVSFSAQGPPCAPAPGTPGWEIKAVSGGRRREDDGGHTVLTPHPPA